MSLATDDDARACFGQLLQIGQPDSFQKPARPLVARDEAAERKGAYERRSLAAALARAVEHNRQPTESVPARLLEQLEPALGIGRDQRRGAPGQSRRHGLLVAGLDLEQRERQQLAGLGQSPRRRRDALALLERALEHAQPLGRVPGPFAEAVALQC